MSTYYRNIHTGAVFLPPEDIALSSEWEPVEVVAVGAPPAAPKPEIPAEPMGENAWVRDRNGDRWYPMRDGQWTRVTGTNFVEKSFGSLARDNGPLEVHEDGDES